jgi:hypothetical protein
MSILKRLSLLLFIGISCSTIGQVTVTKTYTAPSSVSFDGCGTYCGGMPGVTFDISDFPAGTCEITDVNVSITWAKTDGSCEAPLTGSSFHNETNFRIDGPTGTNVVLIQPGSYTGNASISAVTTVFNQGSPMIGGVDPFSGTFGPNNGNLNDFNGTSPFGIWTLRPGDTGGGDPLCVVGYSVSVTAVLDMTPPVTPVLPALTNECSVTAVAPSTTDNCAGTIVGTTSDPLTYTSQGSYTINWTFDDGNGNSIVVPQTVTIDDVSAPATPVLAALTDDCSVTAVAPSTTDNCAGTIVGTTSDPLTYTSQGSYTINWTFDDGNGNSIVVPQTVTIDDVSAPATPVLAALTDDCSVTAVAPSTTDNCAGTIVGTTSDPLTYTSQGSYTINWTFDDGNGNSIVVPQTVTIDDVTAPATPVLAALTDDCSVTAVAPTTTDNCAGTIVGTTSDPLTYTAQGSYTINWTFDDGNGNSIVVPQTVTIDDVSAPATPVLAALTDDCSVTAVAPSTTDNCAGTIVGTTSDPLTYTSQGSYTINWTFDDGNGNSIVVPQTVTIDDVTAPATPVLAALTDDCLVTAVAPSTTDNCAGTIVGTTSDPLTYTAQGSYTINWTFDDGNGNSIVVPQTVTIDDVTAPTPDLATLVDLSDNCEITSLTSPTATDNCSGSVTATHDAILPITSSTVITWTYDDGNGNTATQTQNVTINGIDVSTTLAGNGVVISANNSGASSYQWIDCTNGNSIIVNETNMSYTATVNGDYAVIITEGNCTDTSECVSINSVGISDLKANELVLFPNPTNDILNIEIDEVIQSVEVIDMLGRKVSVNVDLKESKVDVSNLEPGKYMIRIITANNRAALKEFIIVR